ncbi:PREDICTED: uncharacterized protein LOC109228653 [Nicotiana attenuata]|uniref:uncharacterized protein LOC109228653 n=1 Tax=Nicotiana attenuata TaxID=49451 RepID=UPI0009053FED|nr:PREDICTED: uncharacterized protein LOC109228653 [Nicotiana attenuata]
MFIVWFCPHRFSLTCFPILVGDLGIYFSYTLRHVHQSRVEHRLESIEKAMKNNYQIEDPEFKKLVSGSITLPACVATAGTTLIIGYGLGWRGGKWYANRKFRREQMKLLGQIKPKRWPLRFLRRPLIRPKSPENLLTGSEALPKDASVSHR